jgi:hypothetical protein
MLALAAPQLGTVRASGRRLQKVLKPGRLVDVRATINASARVTSVTGVKSLGQTSVRGADLRRGLGLRSTWFRIGILALTPPTTPIAFGMGGKLTRAGTRRQEGGTRAASETAWSAVAPVQPQANGLFAVTVRPTISTHYRLTAGQLARQRPR